MPSSNGSANRRVQTVLREFRLHIHNKLYAAVKFEYVVVDLYQAQSWIGFGLYRHHALRCRYVKRPLIAVRRSCRRTVRGNGRNIPLHPCQFTVFLFMSVLMFVLMFELLIRRQRWQCQRDVGGYNGRGGHVRTVGCARGCRVRCRAGHGCGRIFRRRHEHGTVCAIIRQSIVRLNCWQL